MENTIHRLTLFYDASCGICRHARTWLSKQPAYLELHFVDFRSEKARELLPAITKLHPEREIVVLADNGAIYQGGSAWVMCLWATQNWREWSLRLASPALLPLAGKFVSMVARNRYRLSKLFGMRETKDAATLARELNSAELEGNCETGSCPVGFSGPTAPSRRGPPSHAKPRKHTFYPTRTFAIVFSFFELPALAACSLFVAIKLLGYPLLVIVLVPLLVLAGILAFNHLGMAMAKPVSHRPWMVWKWTAVFYTALLLISLLTMLGSGNGMLSTQFLALALFAIATVLSLVGISMEEDHWKNAPAI